MRVFMQTLWFQTSRPLLLYVARLHSFVMTTLPSRFRRLKSKVWLPDDHIVDLEHDETSTTTTMTTVDTKAEGQEAQRMAELNKETKHSRPFKASTKDMDFMAAVYHEAPWLSAGHGQWDTQVFVDLLDGGGKSGTLPKHFEYESESETCVPPTEEVSPATDDSTLIETSPATPTPRFAFERLEHINMRAMEVEHNLDVFGHGIGRAPEPLRVVEVVGDGIGPAPEPLRVAEAVGDDTESGERPRKSARTTATLSTE